ncbi:MAG: hypothetical protein KatS3mg078_1747 [Deltaproteobacteria bacterium]|nr:MAG: hypothetical protein KatS3mg078_1747 [Deltaproteobacteria bacterium]
MKKKSFKWPVSNLVEDLLGNIPDKSVEMLLEELEKILPENEETDDKDKANKQDVEKSHLEN